MVATLDEILKKQKEKQEEIKNNSSIKIKTLGEIQKSNKITSDVSDEPIPSYKKVSYFNQNSLPETKKNIGSTAAYTSSKVATGAFSVVEGLADVGAWLLKQTGKITAWMVDNPVGKAFFGEDAADYKNTPFYQIGDQMIQDEITETIDKQIDESKMAKQSYVEPDSLGANIASGVGQVGGMILTGKVFSTGKIGTIANNATKGQKILNSMKIAINNPTTKSMFLSTFGNSYSQASNSGANDLDASLYGLLNATKESTTEMIYGGLGAAFGKGALDDIAKEGIDKLIYSKLGETVKSKILSKVSQLGISMFAEGMEEVLATILDPFVESVYTHNLDFSSYNSILDDFIVGALVSGVLETGSNIVNLKGKNPEEIAIKLQQQSLQEKLDVISTQTNQIVDDENIDNKTKIDRINNQLDILNDQLIQDVPVGTINMQEIYNQKVELTKKRDSLMTNTTEQQKIEIVNNLSNQVEEVLNASEESIDNAIIDTTEDKVQQIEKLTDEIEKDKKIKVLSNKQKIKLNGQQYINRAAALIEQLNRNIPEGQKSITIVTELNQEQRQVMDLASVFGKQVIFTENLPFSGGLNNRLPNTLFVDSDIQSGLLKGKKGAMLYTMGHELFHSLRLTDAKTYNQFIDYTKKTINIQQVVDFMQRYDPNETNIKLDSLKIDGKFDLQKIVDNPSKYKSQNKVFDTVVEEIVANEFGGMITDKTYMNTLYNDNPSLFARIVDAIRELFKSLTGSVYNTSLTQLQVEKIRNDFENIVSEIGQKNETKKPATTKIQENESKQTSEYQIPETLYRSTNSGITTPKAHSVPGAKFYSTKQEISARYSKSGETKTANIVNTIKNPLIIEGNGELYKNISFENKTMRTDDIVAIAKERGYDGVIFKNIIDTGPVFHGKIADPVSDIIVTIEQTDKPTEVKQEVKKPVEVKEEIKEKVKPGTQGMKTTQMDMGAWFDNINKMYDKYVETKDSDRLAAVTNAYENYKKKGGTEVISELDSVIETKAKADFKSKLKDAGLKIKALPKNSIDSKGRQLTNSQTAFFNNSKARDTDGNLLVMYHHTNGQFDTFDKSMQGTNTRASNTKLGFFFSPNEEFTKRFGKNKKEVYLNLENPLHFPTKDSSDSQVIEYLKITEQEDKIKRLENQVKRLNKENENDIPYTMGSVFDFAINYYDEPGTIKFKRNMKDLRNYAEKAGYDSIIMPLETIAFYANQIKYVDNKNPGSSNDMRYLPKEITDTAGQQKESQFYSNTAVNSPIFKSIIASLSKNEGFRYYSTVSHKTDFNKAVERIRQRGDAAITDFFSTKSFDSVDSAMAKILIEYYQAIGDFQSEINVEIKFRKALTQGAQVVESAKIFKMMSPASLMLQVQSDLTRAYEELQQSNDPIISSWIRENADGLTLSDAENDWLYRNFESLQKMDPDSHEYKRKYAIIQSFIASKIPKSIATKIKAFRRLSMLFNPKTMTRNYLGNLIVSPVNRVSDRFSSFLDYAISKKTGVRTIGSTDKQAFKEGKKQGRLQGKEDFKLGINTDSANAFEIQQGKTWKDKGVGKVFNELERWMNYGLNIGDRPWSEAYYYNSLANQMRLNNVTEATETMKQIAREEANKKTWKNNGKMVQLASYIRRIGNSVGIKNGKLVVDLKTSNVDLGLGDIALPFIMTPANLAVAIYDYSPAAFISVYKNAKSFNKAVKTGVNVEFAQKALVDSFGKASAGVILFAIAYALAKAGIISGGEDEDKDVRALMKAQGYQPYSIKIGDYSFSYDWAQPIANPFAIMAELNRQTQMNKNNPNKSDEANNMFKAVSEAFTIGSNRLYEQSFLQTIKNIFSAESPEQAIVNFTGDIPASFVPTLFKQIADIIDGDTKATYDKNNLLTSTIARTLVKIPGLKSTLPTKKDVLGKDVQGYGGINEVFNVMINPSLVSKDTAGDAGKEIMDVYNHTGVTSIMPQVAVTYIDYDTNNDGIKERITFNTKQQAIIQEYMGQLTDDAINEMLNNSVYINASYDDKATALTSLVQYSKAIALRDTGLIPNYEIKSGNAAQINSYVSKGLSISNAVMYDSLINPVESLKDSNGETIQGSMNGQKAHAIMNMQINDLSKNTMLELISPLSKTPETVNSLSNLHTVQQFIDYYSLSRRDTYIIDKYSRDDYDVSTSYFNIDGRIYTEFASKASEIRADYDKNGDVIPNSKKNKMFQYINSLPLNQYQKLYLFSISGYSIKQYKTQMFNYINNMNISVNEKKQIWSSLGFD